LKTYKKNINPSITENQAIDVGCTSLKPVLSLVWKNYSFVKNNAVSIAMHHKIDGYFRKNNFGKDVDASINSTDL
jgi:predicted helicase